MLCNNVFHEIGESNREPNPTMHKNYKNMLLLYNDVIKIIMFNGSYCLLQCFKATIVKKLNYCLFTKHYNNIAFH